MIPAQTGLVRVDVIPPAVAFLATYPSENSRKTMQGALKVLAGILLGLPGPPSIETALHLPWEKITLAHAQALRAKLMARYDPAGVNVRLAALRGVLKQCWLYRLISVEDYHRIKEETRSVKIDKVLSGRMITLEEVTALIKVATPRNALIVVLGYACGMRRHEIAKVRIEDYDPVTRAITVKGKGRKTRVVYLPKWGVQYLSQWIMQREAPGLGDGPLFDIGPSAVSVIVDRLVKAAGVKHLTPHDFRRTFGTTLLDADVDVLTVQQLFGHESANTTARYDQRGEKKKKESVELIPAPKPR